MNAIDALFQRLRRDGRKAFIPFVTAGDPDADGAVEAARTLAVHGAGLIEIGFPYSDPIADGPVIQASYTRAWPAASSSTTCSAASAVSPPCRRSKSGKSRWPP